MKTIGRVFLTINLILAFISLLFAITFKFQFLNSNFWIKTFSQNHVYQNFQKGVEKGLTDQVIKSGGSPREAKGLTSFLTPEVLQDVVEKNVVHLVDFLNGKGNSLIVYIPLKKLPAGILPKNFSIKNDEINLESLVPTLNQTQTSNKVNYRQLASSGTAATIGVVVAVIFLLLSLWGLYKSNDPGTNLVAVGIGIVITAVVSLVLIGAINVYRINISQQLPRDGAESGQILLGSLVPSIILEISKLWIIICGVTILVGILICFIKKPGVKTS